jgi:hypothetical protein
MDPSAALKATAGAVTQKKYIYIYEWLEFMDESNRKLNFLNCYF